MDLVRAALRTDDLPVVVGRISDSGVRNQKDRVWMYGEIVRTAQAEFVRTDAAAALVTSTDNYDYSDPWHYDTSGYIDLGSQFATHCMVCMTTGSDWLTDRATRNFAHARGRQFVRGERSESNVLGASLALRPQPPARNDS